MVGISVKYQLVFSFKNNNIYSDIITVKDNREVEFRNKYACILRENDNIVATFIDHFFYKNWNLAFWVSIYEPNKNIPTLINMETVESVTLEEVN